jgi:hypothetical protein
MTKTRKVILWLLFSVYLAWAACTIVLRTWPQVAWTFTYRRCQASAQGNTARLKECRRAYIQACLDAAWHRGLDAAGLLYEEMETDTSLSEAEKDKRFDVVVDRAVADARPRCNPE